MRLWYDVWSASDCGVNEHPQQVMKELGFKLLHSEPYMIADGWRFEVADTDIELPPYISKDSGRFSWEK